MIICNLRNIKEILLMMGTVLIILCLSMTQGVYKSLILIILFTCLIRYICSNVPGHGVVFISLDDYYYFYTLTHTIRSSISDNIYEKKYGYIDMPHSSWIDYHNLCIHYDCIIWIACYEDSIFKVDYE
ncbi:hypothetical protein BDA99DRAFT_531746 [Phascolomyces articulosus]|uniref:Uncharacterized protein n=1 Tax=Phascolomyces articulosus TaxID=60185 RepID=A0AAD5KMP2_9FUNG|nr:hypothetical protein BDA99DRAFT_531746 [Phascolomyces articulosus]